MAIIVGISSGIAAFRASELVRNLKKDYDVKVIMTGSARKMIPEKEFEKASGVKPENELFQNGFSYRKILKKRKVEHIALADSASVIVVAPATANIIAKIANGIADDLLTTVILAAKARVILCPSMNANMLDNDATMENIRKLLNRGFILLEPDSGNLACGYYGNGRLPEISRIEREVRKNAEKGNELRGSKVIVTAGGTEEDIDDMRVITNRSSGKTGILIAEEFSRRGAEVILIRGRSEKSAWARIKEIRVRTSGEMLSAIRRTIRNCDIIVHAAAVGDFKVKKKTNGKLDSSSDMVLELTRNEKIIGKIKGMKKNIFLVGFKAECNLSQKELLKRAVDSMKSAECDLIVANDICRNMIGGDENEVIIADSAGNTKYVKKTTKRVIAERIVDEVCKRIKK